MKKLFLMLALAVPFTFMISSCEEDENDLTINETINATVLKNNLYNFSLPENFKDQEYRITDQTSHGMISIVQVDQEGNQVYAFVPVKDYVGTDRVVLETIEDNDGKKGHGSKHSCGNKDKDSKHVFTININVIDSNSK